MALPNIESQFDILGEPPTADKLADWRRLAAREVTRMSFLVKATLAARFVFALVVGGPLMVWFVGSTLALSPGVAGVAIALASVSSYLVGVVVALLVGEAVLFVVCGGVWCADALRSAEFELRKLFELDYSEFPGECQRFVVLCGTDPAVRAYQHKLVALGRKPVYGEHLSAEAWAEGAAARSRALEAETAAKDACSRLAVVI